MHVYLPKFIKLYTETVHFILYKLYINLKNIFKAVFRRKENNVLKDLKTIVTNGNTGLRFWFKHY